MAKKKTTDEQDEINYNKVLNVELKDTSLSLIKDDNGDWLIVRLMYDMKTGTVGKPEIVTRERSRDLIHERFRIILAQELF